jgi:hypothetical protein
LRRPVHDGVTPPPVETADYANQTAASCALADRSACHKSRGATKMILKLRM